MGTIEKSIVKDLSRMAPGGSEGLIRPYINDRLNSRLNVRLPKGLWEIKWRSPLLKGINPRFILQYQDRVLVQGVNLWQLFNLEGKPISVNSFGFGDVEIDTLNKLIYCFDINSMLHAFRLADGKISFILDNIYGVKYDREFITRYNNTFYSLSNELIPDPHSEQKPELSYIEAQNIGVNQQVDNLNILTSSVREKIEERKSGEAIAASNENLFVLAYRNTVEYLDRNLTVRAKYEDKFLPMTMSLDNSSSVYVIIKTEEQKNFLWVLNSDGEKTGEFPLPYKEEYQPPCVGFNGRIYVNLMDRLMAFLPGEGLLWDRSVKNIAGIVSLSDDLLLVAEDKYLLAFDNDGERKFIYEFQDDPLRTQPFITQNGKIYVADSKFLYCLATQNSDINKDE